ncbi:hypothetical protein ASPZODRAFT_1187784 [Penicilliopsis zonata CBS 506.65]|uniref:Uncharacterized protein n=1 Tax=Penicilliopsis zonata CBS 506.65 TaxID=1073090 RepID=A0A1L9S7Y1_9EURO|nr:hypothetical protein ASPZODRAFT_1187784 [Penicilliopsis zonata CBS 506.65]OJJ43264.1 hypothetical protein ASPZODRAFT_1187784 [Penicilliopsis zonata CBS 506.65]
MPWQDDLLRGRGAQTGQGRMEPSKLRTDEDWDLCCSRSSSGSSIDIISISSSNSSSSSSSSCSSSSSSVV